MSSAILDFVGELIAFIGDLASGKMDLDKARKRAAELQARAPEHLTDDLLAELDRKIAALEAEDTEPG